MKVTKGRSSKGVILTSSKGSSLRSLVVPGQGRVTVVNGAAFKSAKSAAGSRLSQAIKTVRDANQK